MTTPNLTPDNLEQHLTELTTHRGPETQLWQKALDQAAKHEPSSWIIRLAAIRIRHPALLAVAACLALAVVIAITVPSLHGARDVRTGSVRLPSPSAIGFAQGLGLNGEFERQGMAPIESKQRYGTGDLAGDRASVDGAFRLHDAQVFDQQDLAPAAGPATRHVVQKSTIELQTPDVRAVFAKASHLIASGEFVEASSLTGDGKTAQANLTLRVAASRLSEVLNKLRELGTVKSENTTGEDVTSQVVDLEARIRNEQRIEKELLELLDKRADAPLKDILELRNSLSNVRQSIESYIAQRDRLGRLVSLASILVVIRAEPSAAEKPEPAQSIFTYFRNSAAGAWHDGLRTASDSVSWLLNLLIAGLLWWLLLATLILSILRYRRRLAARCV